MNFSIQDTYEMYIFPERVSYCRNITPKSNFRFKIDNNDLDQGVLINFPNSGTYYSYRSDTSSIPYSHRFDRAGVIPYIKVNDSKYFCLAVDSMYGTLTDFGGCVKSIETFPRASSRELFEESLGIFKFSPRSIYENSKAVYDKNMIVMFLRLEINNLDMTVRDFHKRLSRVTKSETSSIMWIPEDILFNLIKTGTSIKMYNYIYPAIYKPVADLLRSVCNMNEIV